MERDLRAVSPESRPYRCIAVWLGAQMIRIHGIKWCELPGLRVGKQRMESWSASTASEETAIPTGRQILVMAYACGVSPEDAVRLAMGDIGDATDNLPFRSDAVAGTEALEEIAEGALLDGKVYREAELLEALNRLGSKDQLDQRARRILAAKLGIQTNLLSEMIKAKVSVGHIPCRDAALGDVLGVPLSRWWGLGAVICNRGWLRSLDQAFRAYMSAPKGLADIAIRALGQLVITPQSREYGLILPLSNMTLENGLDFGRIDEIPVLTAASGKRFSVRSFLKSLRASDARDAGVVNTPWIEFAVQELNADGDPVGRLRAEGKARNHADLLGALADIPFLDGLKTPLTGVKLRVDEAERLAYQRGLPVVTASASIPQTSSKKAVVMPLVTTEEDRRRMIAKGQQAIQQVLLRVEA